MRISPSSLTRRTTNNAGITNLELLILAGMVAILAVVCWPVMAKQKVRDNEQRVIAMLKQIATIQTMAQESALIDSDRDGVGEFCYFQELAGTRRVRACMETTPEFEGEETYFISPALLPKSLGEPGKDGRVSHDGYYFKLLLPGKNGGWLAERPVTEPYPAVEPDRAELSWICLAWPIDYGGTRADCFIVDQSQRILRSSTHPNALVSRIGSSRQTDTSYTTLQANKKWEPVN